MDAAELSERVLVCLRGCDIGESISADGIADEIGGKLSDVYDALEDLENAKLVEMHPAYRKGSDPTYTLTPKGKRHMQPEIKERPEPEPVKEEHVAPEPRPSADRVCRFCGKVIEPNKLRRHENMCGKNPDRPHTPPKFFKKAEPKEGAAVEVPDPSEYAEESTSSITIEHEAPVEPESPEFLEQLNAEDPDLPDEIPVQVQDVLVLKGSPGMSAALRLLSYCQRAVAEGADLSLHANLKVAEGLYVAIDLELPVGQDGEVEPVE